MRVYLRTPYAPCALGLEIENSISGLEALEKCCQRAGVPPQAITNLRLVHRGRSLPPAASLAAAGVTTDSLLELLPSLRGGGGDGGSTGAEDRRAWLEMYAGKKHDKVNPEEERLARWTACHISGMPLQPPCVADELGSLYNKDSILQSLIAKSMPPSLAHISSLKHLIDVVLSPADGAKADAAVRFGCPVTGLQMNGRARFVMIRRGGTGSAHILSERAIKDLPEVAKEIVGGAWEAEDVTPLYPQGDELDKLAGEVLARRHAEKAAKQAKKLAKAGAKRAAAGGGVDGVGGEEATDGIEQPPAAAAAATKKAKAAAAAAPSSAVPAPANATSAVWNSLFTKKDAEGDGKKKNSNNDYMLRGGLKYVA